MNVGFGTFVMIFFGVMIFGIFISKFKHIKIIPIISIAGAIFFLVYAFINKEKLYYSLFFFLVFGFAGIRNLIIQKRQLKE